MTEPNDDPSVADDETLLRRIPDLGRADFFPIDQATGERRLSSGAFTPDEDGARCTGRQCSLKPAAACMSSCETH